MVPEFDWPQIDTVLLDMDGTLLDLEFDSHFWLSLVPQALSESAPFRLTKPAILLSGNIRRCSTP